MSPATQESGTRVLWAPDGRAASAELLHQVAAHGAAWRANPGNPPPDLWVVVPSAAARRWCLAQLLARAPGARLGVEVRTAIGLALEITERSGRPPTASRERFEIESRRVARAAPGLSAALGELERGFDAAARSLRTLIEAGIAPEDVERGRELLAEAAPRADPRDPELERTAELVAIAGTLSTFAGGPAALFREAARCLEEASAWRPANVILHGYRAARGVEGEFLAALCAAPSTTILALGDAGREGGLERLAQRSEALAAAPPNERLLHRAPSLATEVFHVVRDLARAIHEDEVAPERIAVCAFGSERYARQLRADLTAFGVPFSAAGLEGPLSPIGRRLAALVELFEQGPRTRTRRALALWEALEPSARERLALALELFGASQLAAWSRLDVDARLGGRDALPLPMALGSARAAQRDELADEGFPSGNAVDGDATDEEAGARQLGARQDARVLRASLPRAELADGVAWAGELMARLARFDEPGLTAAAARRATSELASQALGWRADDPARVLLERELDGLLAALDPTFALDSAEEWLRALSERLTACSREPLGGAGGGVQLAPPAWLAGFDWDRTYVLGLDAQHAPQRAASDPLLPGSRAAPLRALLPDLPLREDAALEQHAVFRDLCASAPRVWLSHAQRDDEGRALEATAWIAELARPIVDLAPRRRGGTDPQPVLERATALLLESGGRGLEACLTACTPPGSPVDAARVSRARAALVAELDLSPRAAADRGPGPFHGLVGPDPERAPEHRDLYVTTFEGLATCGWRTFLERLLPLQPVPDAESSLPALEQGLVGLVVHGVLQAWAEHALAEGAEDGAALPDARTLDGWCTAAAQRVSFDAGLPLPGYARAYAERARPAVELALRLGGERPRLLAAEAKGKAEIVLDEEHAVTLHFRVDRTERDPRDPAVSIFSDYKTGRPTKPDSARRSTLVDHLTRDVARGRRLQAAAYALSAPGRVGRYLFLSEAPVKLEDEGRVLDLVRGEGSWEAEFHAAVGALAWAWRQGAFAPRLVDARGVEPKACSWCEVSDACLRGDSGVRQAFETWAQTGAPENPDAGELEHSFFAWLILGQRDDA